MLEKEDWWDDLPITRKEALESGAKKFFKRTPCLYGHTTPRWASSRKCMGCTYDAKKQKAEYDRQYREKNQEALRIKNAKYRAENAELIAAGKKRCAERKPEKYKATQRAGYLKNRDERLEWHKSHYRENAEKISAQAKIYRTKNADACRERGSRWKRANKDIVNAYVAKRRAKKKKATPIWSDELAIKAIYKQAKELDESTGIIHHVDHIIPINSKIVCGLHVEYNLRVITKEENLDKNNKLLEEFAY